MPSPRKARGGGRKSPEMFRKGAAGFPVENEMEKPACFSRLIASLHFGLGSETGKLVSFYNWYVLAGCDAALFGLPALLENPPRLPEIWASFKTHYCKLDFRGKHPVRLVLA